MKHVPFLRRTAFFLFAKDKRPQVRDAHPDFGVTDISRELGKIWKELPHEEKTEYEKKALKALYTFEKDIATGPLAMDFELSQGQKKADH